MHVYSERRRVVSETAPDGVYVYQPWPATRKDGLLWGVSGLPCAMTREAAQALADVINRHLKRTTCPCGFGAQPWHQGGMCNIGRSSQKAQIHTCPKCGPECSC